MGQPLKLVGYEEDFHAWADDQARLLRDRNAHEADLQHIAEELEGLSRSERRALQSSLRLIVLHLLKLIHQPEKATQSWRNTIYQERINVEDALSDMPSLRARLPELFAKAYVEGQRLAIQEMGKSPERFWTLPELTLEQVRDDMFMPVPLIQDSKAPNQSTEGALSGSSRRLPAPDAEE